MLPYSSNPNWPTKTQQPQQSQTLGKNQGSLMGAHRRGTTTVILTIFVVGLQTPTHRPQPASACAANDSRRRRVMQHGQRQRPIGARGNCWLYCFLTSNMQDTLICATKNTKRRLKKKRAPEHPTNDTQPEQKLCHSGETEEEAAKIKSRRKSGRLERTSHAHPALARKSKSRGV